MLDFDYSSKSFIGERKNKVKDSEDLEDPEDEIPNFSNIIFDGWIDNIIV
jgi:hypothetical protein